MIEVRPDSHASILQALADGATVVTANIRLSGHLRAAFDARQMAAGRKVWDSPDLLPWNDWLQRLWQWQWMSPGTDSMPPLLLSDAQAQLLWEKVIQESPTGERLLQVAATARRAHEAAGLVQSWRIGDCDFDVAYNKDTAAFAQWQVAVEGSCRNRHWMLPAQLPGALLQGLAAGRWQAPGHLILVGFDELTPQQQHFCRELLTAGTRVEWVELTGDRVQALRCEFSDARSEAIAAARWARARLESSPGAAIAIVVPDLRTLHEPMVQALDSVLVPHALQPTHWEQQRPYNLSLGRALTDYPLVQCALDILKLLQPSVPLAVLGRVLQSPFLQGWDEELSARALLDAQLRANGEIQVSLNTLQYWASREDKSCHCPLLAEKLSLWRAATRRRPGQQAAGRWAEHFSKLLDTLGWSRGRTLSSDEFQTLEVWRATLADLASVEPIAGMLTQERALQHLVKLASGRTFQPKRPDVPIQVLGILETSGLNFDHLWVMGLHDGVWPAAPRPNPFIPLPLQRDRQMPHASASRELAVAQRITARLMASASEVVFSTPRMDGERTLRNSPLLESCRAVDSETLELWQGSGWRDHIYQANGLAEAGADVAPPVPAAQVRGGSSVFKYQAACPFRAFAELRLGARPLEAADIGLDARTRGSLMHKVLEIVWSQLVNHAGLTSLAADALQDLVERSVAQAIEAVAFRYPETLTDRFRAAEQARLASQVLAWLDMERDRLPFVSVQSEQAFMTTLGGIEVKVTIDRIDELEDGRKLLIDYKTGAVQPKQWFGERPEEPQLPLYSTVVQGNVAAVAFGQLQAGNLRFNGIAEEKGLLPQVHEFSKPVYRLEAQSWEAVLHDWRNTLSQLGEDFRAGKADVDPKDPETTCRYCSLQPLCRINERTVLDAGDGDA